MRKLALAAGSGGADAKVVLAVGVDDEVERAGVAHPLRGPVAGDAGGFGPGVAGAGEAGVGVGAGAGEGAARAGEKRRQKGDGGREQARDANTGTVRAPLHRP